MKIEFSFVVLKTNIYPATNSSAAKSVSVVWSMMNTGKDLAVTEKDERSKLV